MSLIEKLNQIERLDNLIRRKATGTPRELAERLDLSERQVYNVIRNMKELGAPVYFSTLHQSYCYEHNVTFTFGFRQTDLAKISGGKNILLNIVDCNFISVTATNLKI